MGKVAVISLAVLFVAVVNAVKYDFRVPANCDPHVSINDTYLLTTTTVKTRGMCARECARNARCASLTTVGDHPNVECKLYEQVMNRYGLYASPDPDSSYLEKKRQSAGSSGGYRPRACNRESSDVGGACDKRDSSLFPGDYLLAEEYLCSANLQYRACMQTDGNFVLYDFTNETRPAVWSTDTLGQPAHRARLLDSGEFVLEDVDGIQLYSTGTTGEPGYLRLTPNGQLRIIDTSDAMIWSTN